MFKYFRFVMHRRSLSMALAVFTAIVMNRYFSFSNEGWMILAAFVVCQTTRGTPLKQGLSYLFVLALIAILFPADTMQMVKLRLIDVVIGGVIGVIYSQALQPRNIYGAFTSGIVPLLDALMVDTKLLAERFANKTHDDAAVMAKISTVENILGSRESMYPEWVYEIGFNPGLRAGYRYFLLHIERMCEISFSLNYLSHRAISSDHISTLRENILQVLRTNEDLLQLLVEYFSSNTWRVDVEDDFTSDMRALEQVFAEQVPQQVELLDIAPDNIIVAGVVRDLKDMRTILLQLILVITKNAQQ